MIKAQVATADDIKNLEGNSLKFPNEDDIKLINNNFEGLKAQVVIPNELLIRALDVTSEIY